jgi:hypothetical protein
MIYKILKILFFSFFINCAHADIKIVYVNGIWNGSESEVIESKELLREALKRNGLSPKYPHELQIRHYYNPSSGKAQDLYELKKQAKISNDAIQYALTRGANITEPEKSEFYKKYIGQEYLQKITNDAYKKEKEYKIYTPVKDLFDIAWKEVVVNNNKIIFVAHSQGNFILEALYAYASEFNNSRLKEGVRYVGFGSVAMTSPNNNYINIQQDQAIYSLLQIDVDSDITFDNKYFHPPARAVTACHRSSNCDAAAIKVNTLARDSGDPILHQVASIYLSKDITFVNGGMSLDKLISNQIINAVNILRTIDKKPTQIAFTLGTTTASNWFSRTLNTAFAFLGIRDAVAQSLPSLFAYVNSGYTVRVDGTGFDGNEAVSIAGSTCNTATIQRGSGYFTQQCTGGSAAADSNKIRVYDTTYDLDIEVPTAYQTMQLRGPILAPLAPALTEPTTGTIRLSWSAVSGATGYEVSRGGTAISTVGTTTSYDDAGRTAGTPYCYRLRTIQGGIMSAYSPEACYTPATIRCAGTWNNTQYSVGATETTTQACQSGYTGNKTLSHICQASGNWGTTTTQDNCTLTPAPTCTGTWSSAKYLIGQLEEVYQNNCPAGTTGQVRSWHTCQASGSSAVWGGLSQSDNCTAYLATPTDVRTSSLSTGVQITWAAVSGATSYRLHKNTSTSVYQTISGSTSYIDTAVTNGTIYNYAVSAYSNYNGQNVVSSPSSWSQVTYSSGQTSINPPTNVQAARGFNANNQKGIVLTWLGAANADSYLIYRRGYNNPYTSAAYLAPVGGTDVSFVDVWSNFSGSIVTGQSYCYYIRAVRGSTNSVESNEACSLAP